MIIIQTVYTHVYRKKNLPFIFATKMEQQHWGIKTTVDFSPAKHLWPSWKLFFYFRHFQSPIFRSYLYAKSHQKNSHPNSCNLHVDFSPCKRKYSEKIIFKHQHICLVKISMKKIASEFTSFGGKNWKTLNYQL